MSFFVIIAILYILDKNWMSDAIKDIKELSTNTKIIAVSILIFAALWFLTMCAYCHSIPTFGWVQIVIALVAPTSIWYLLEVGTATYLLPLKKIKIETENDQAAFWVMVLIDGLIYFVIMAAIAYFTHMRFRNFCFLAFGFRGGGLLLLFLTRNKKAAF